MGQQRPTGDRKVGAYVDYSIEARRRHEVTWFLLSAVSDIVKLLHVMPSRLLTAW